MSRRLSIFLLFILIASAALAQITTAEYPPSFYHTSNLNISTEHHAEIEEPNLKAFRKQDKLDEHKKSVPWRFGKLIPTNYTLKNKGEMHEDEAGNLIWKLQIKAKGAMSINLNFDDFFLSKNAKLYIFGKSFNDAIGALTKSNNRTDGQFAIRPVLGDEIHLELIAPKAEFFKNRVSIHELVYGYRSIHEKAAKVFRSSGNCNLNINCTEGDDWQTLKRAVAMITTSSNTRICTGVLLNNVRQDTIPYLLTAAHCNVPSTSIFIFNYESAKCSPTTDGILTNSVTGATTRAVATSNSTDFELMELTNRPPQSYKVYYAGWSAEGLVSPQSATIHHPSGDVKKISLDKDSSISSGYYTRNGSTHWTIGNWETGTTESGSSGAPLFNSNQRVIGSLHGGDASCSFIAEDYFGKFSVSWDDNSTKSRQLKAWLDPDSTGILVLDGLSTDTAAYDKDIAIINISGIHQYFCDTLINPLISIRNEGNDTIFDVSIDYHVDGDTVATVVHKDTLVRNELIQIKLPAIRVSAGSQYFYAHAKILNHTDQDSSNNKKAFHFLSTEQSETLTVEVKTDDYGAETSWALHDLFSSIKISSGGPYASRTGGQTLTKSICVPDTICFFLDLFDSGDDGFTSPHFGKGHLLVKNQKGDTLLFNNNFKTSFKRDTFCLNDTFTSVKEYGSTSPSFQLFPNPVFKGNELKIKNTDGRFEAINYRILDATGRLVLEGSSNKIDIPKHMKTGLYYLEIRSKTEQRLTVEKLLIR